MRKRRYFTEVESEANRSFDGVTAETFPVSGCSREELSLPCTLKYFSRRPQPDGRTHPDSYGIYRQSPMTLHSSTPIRTGLRTTQISPDRIPDILRSSFKSAGFRFTKGTVAPAIIKVATARCRAILPKRLAALQYQGGPRMSIHAISRRATNEMNVVINFLLESARSATLTYIVTTTVDINK